MNSIFTKLFAALLAAGILLAGCKTQVKMLPAAASLNFKGGSARQAGGPWWWNDELNRQAIYRYELSRTMGKDPVQALAELDRIAMRTGKAEDGVAVADLSVRYALMIERTKPELALGLFLRAAELSSHSIARSGVEMLANQSNARLCRIYNLATAGVVAAVQTLPGGVRTNHLATLPGRQFRLEAEPDSAGADAFFYDRWLPADSWTQLGLAHHYWNEGWGARLIAARTNHAVTTLERHQPDEGIFQPATAILQFGASSNNPVEVKLVFYNPIYTSEIEMEGCRYELAADYTMPWAALLARAHPLGQTRWKGLAHPAETSRTHRLYLMEPYEPGRIPIIMVHGLFSTPLAWQQLTNELLGDPEIRRRYQIWHYLYPTGLPFLSSAALFREDIEEVRKMVDPADHDFATHHMVVIGHSMGGLLARTLVTDTGDALWNSTFSKPISALELKPEQAAELRRTLYFQPKPYVERVILIAVPHRGSKQADSFLARAVAGRVHLPSDFNTLISELLSAYPDLLKPEAASLFNHGYPNSIQSLSPRATALIALADLPFAPSVPYHSIIADRGLGGGVKSSDGLVPYSSSHLAGASSEVIVPALHGAAGHPAVIAEVKRILKLHLRERERKAAP